MRGLTWGSSSGLLIDPSPTCALTQRNVVVISPFSGISLCLLEISIGSKGALPSSRGPTPLLETPLVYPDSRSTKGPSLWLFGNLTFFETELLSLAFDSEQADKRIDQLDGLKASLGPSSKPLPFHREFSSRQDGVHDHPRLRSRSTGNP